MEVWINWNNCYCRSCNVKQKQGAMRKAFGLFLIVYGLGLSTFFGWWALRDNVALKYAVKTQSPQTELRHRINVGFEGVWFLMSNLIVIAGAANLRD